MKIIDIGSGPPLVVIPGLQGRWEWMRPAVNALARRCRVITFSLADEPSAKCQLGQASGFESYVEQIRHALDASHLASASICGVSYGGLIAAAFAARYPDRVSSLVLVSALPPSWKPNARVRFYMGAPRLLFPVFLVASLRLYREIAAATPGFMAGLGVALRHAWNVTTHMTTPLRMAGRVRLLDDLDLQRDLPRVHVPTLLVTGTPELDRIVPPSATREYSLVWPHAVAQTLDRTGHLGLITRADEFASIVATFVENSWREADPRRRVG
jgi:pimeloyl-ACP methyl ester carboxylesterase